jgi:hypothetical protein
MTDELPGMFDLTIRQKLWIPVVTVIAVTWYFFLGVDINPLLIGNYGPLFVAGIVVGVISGAPPTKAFLICFWGYAVISLLWVVLGLAFSPNLVEGSILTAFFIAWAILCGLFGMGGALLRQLALCRKVEKVVLKSWQWLILVGTVIISADLIIIPEAYNIIESLYLQVSLFTISAGFLGLGLLIGAFLVLDYRSTLKSAAKWSAESHLGFLVPSLLLVVRSGGHFKGIFISFPFIAALFMAILMVGVHFGYHSRSRIE